MNISPAMVLC